MPDLYVVRPVSETTEGGLFGTVELPGGRVWVLHGRRLAEASHDAEPVERAMTTDDVDAMLALGIIDRRCALRQVLRVLR